MYDKEETVIGKALNKGDLAIKFIMPQDIDYATEKQKEHISDYLLIDYHHVYSDECVRNGCMINSSLARG